MAHTDLSVCNLAIQKAQGEPIGSFEDNSPLAALAQSTYPNRRAMLLSAHRWVFAKSLVPLQAITPPTGAPYPYAFAPPNGIVGAIHDYRSGPAPDAAKVAVLQLDGYLAGEDPVVWVEFTKDVPEAQWPPWFVNLVVTAFAEDVASARGRRTRAAELRVEAFGNPEDRMEGGLMGQAKAYDGRNAPQRTLSYENGGPLVSTRFRSALPSPLAGLIGD